MIKTHEREKLINAVVFFARNTNHCGKIKLIKLLYLLDFAHFRQTGRSVTGMNYHAWQLGPVPVALFEEWEDLSADFAEAINIVPEKIIDYVRETAVPKIEFNDSVFSRRELNIMGELALRFKEDYSKPMVNVTHAESGPWSKIWENGKGNQVKIPYTLAVPDNDPNAEVILEAAARYDNMKSTLSVVN